MNKDNEIKMLEGLVDRLNKMIDNLHETIFIAETGILHIAKNTMQGKKWDNYDLHKYVYSLDKKIIEAGKSTYEGWNGKIKWTNLENIRKNKK